MSKKLGGYEVITCHLKEEQYNLYLTLLKACGLDDDPFVAGELLAAGIQRLVATYIREHKKMLDGGNGNGPSPDGEQDG